MKKSLRDLLLLRRILVIRKDLQFRFLAYNALTGIFASVITAVVIKFLARTEGSGINLLGVAFFIAILTGIVAWIVLGLQFTNRIFGPVYRLQRNMQAATRGELLPEIRLRPGDHYVDLIADFNELQRKRLQKP